MSEPQRPFADEVDQLLLNARLRDEIEPFLDDSVTWIDTESVPTPVENEFLASMLAWERAPVIPIYQWFSPELVLPHPDRLKEEELHEVLWDTIDKLFQNRIILDFTDHLSDRQLYTLILRDILPAHEKKIDHNDNYLHWDCISDESPDTWLRFYAEDADREAWAEETGQRLPPSETPPYPRNLPRRPL
jgi:hypothetical protein